MNNKYPEFEKSEGRDSWLKYGLAKGWYVKEKRPTTMYMSNAPYRSYYSYTKPFVSRQKIRIIT